MYTDIFPYLSSSTLHCSPPCLCPGGFPCELHQWTPALWILKRCWKKLKWKFLICVWLFATPWTVVCQAPLSMEFSRREYWSGLPLPSPGDLSDSRIKSRPPALQTDSLLSEPGKPWIYAGFSQWERRLRKWGLILLASSFPGHPFSARSSNGGYFLESRYCMFPFYRWRNNSEWLRDTHNCTTMLLWTIARQAPLSMVFSR